MTQQEQFKTLYAYNWHTTRHLMDCASKLNDDAYHANPGYGHGSIHDLLFHLLRANRGWRVALETGRQQAGIQPNDYTTLQSIKAGVDSEQAAWDLYLETLDDAQITADITLINWRGDPWTMPLWRVLQHLILHGMQHHTELAQLLTAEGQSPGDIDLLFYRGQ
ncbi:MAG: DinB family protein [Anaerolineae bacterium]|nr:DinB family protein [Anaerolineae bacterium]